MQERMQMSKKVNSASIEFFVDEDADALFAFERSAESRSGEILQLPLRIIRDREPAEIQRTIGRLVMSFLNSRSHKGLDLPNDLEDDAKLDAQHYAQLLRLASSDTPESAYEQAVDLISQGIGSSSWPVVERGETLLRQAIDAGLPAAIKYEKEVWFLLRPRLESRLKNK
jgi:hypothetical protein